MKLHLDTSAKWKQILQEINKDEMPVEVMDRVVVNLKDGTAVNVNIRELLLEGVEPDLIESKLNRSLKELDDSIEDVDFHINVDLVIDNVMPVTNRLLKDL